MRLSYRIKSLKSKQQKQIIKVCKERYGADFIQIGVHNGNLAQ